MRELICWARTMGMRVHAVFLQARPAKSSHADFFVGEDSRLGPGRGIVGEPVRAHARVAAHKHRSSGTRRKRP